MLARFLLLAALVAMASGGFILGTDSVRLDRALVRAGITCDGALVRPDCGAAPLRRHAGV